LSASADTFFKRSDFVIAFEALWGYLPLGMVTAIQLLPTKQLKRFRKYTTVAHRVAKNIVDTQTQSYFLGKEGGKDVMSILSESHEELVSLYPNLELDQHRQLGPICLKIRKRN
jgi:hypothetical protein